MDFDQNGGGRRVFQRLGPANSNSNRFNNQSHQNQSYQNQNQAKQNKVCFHWRAGRCNKFPCPFLHSEFPGPSSNGGVAGVSAKRPHSLGGGSEEGFSTRKSPNFSNTWGRAGGVGGAGGGVGKKTERICNYWVQGDCRYGDRCKFLHSWSVGDGFSLLTTLEGHQQGVTGIAWPSGSDKLYTGGKDSTVRVWDCQSGQCAGVINLGGEVGCLISEGPWVFVGIPNLVKAWNAQTGTDLSLSGPVGQVYALVVGNDLLFAATQEGTILAWKYNPSVNTFEPAASLPGHTGPVVTLVVGANRLYSGSMDNSIKVWNLETLQCMQTLVEHKSVVMSVLCWDQFLLSCSLDKTIKVWVATESGNLEVTYTHVEEHGLLTFCGMHDSASKPLLLCSSNDNSVRLHDLPSFSDRGKIFAKDEIRSIQVGPGGLFFTGDGTGQVRVWKWSEQPTAAS
ncbi:Zinc finger CCCH domain-containing protein [Drosera capensis]